MIRSSFVPRALNPKHDCRGSSWYLVVSLSGPPKTVVEQELRVDHSQFGKFRHFTDYVGSRANGDGHSALPKRPHGANLSVQSPIIRGMPVEALSAIRTAA